MRLLAFRAEHDKCLFCAVLDAELKDGRRIVAETANFVAYVPSAARWPYEIHIQPEHTSPTSPTSAREERGELLRLQADVTAAFDGLFDEPIPYLSTLFQAPDPCRCVTSLISASKWSRREEHRGS